MKKVALLVAALLLGTGVSAFAQPARTPQLTLADLQRQVNELRTQMDARKAKKAELCGKLDVNFDFLTVVQGTQRALSDGNSRNVANYRLDMNIERKLCKNSRVFATVRAGEGAGLDLLTFSSINATETLTNEDNLWVRELYYEHSFCKNKLALTFGKMDARYHFDGNVVANNEAEYFMNASFVNNATIAFRPANIGAKLAINPYKFVELSGAYYVTDEGFVANQVDRRLFGIGQVNVKPWKNGNYRFVVWSSQATEEQQGFGLAASVDQKIFKNFTLFGRYGWAEKEYFNIETAVSGGLVVDGNVWKRNDDKAGIAAGRTFASRDFISSPSGKSAETNAELFYSLNAAKGLTLTPSVQYVNTPATLTATDTNIDAFVYGLRAQVKF